MYALMLLSSHCTWLLGAVGCQLTEAFWKWNEAFCRCIRGADRVARCHWDRSLLIFLDAVAAAVYGTYRENRPSLSPVTPQRINLLSWAYAYCMCGCASLLTVIAHKHGHREQSDSAVIGGMISRLTGTLCADTAMLSGWAITLTQRSMSVAKR